MQEPEDSSLHILTAQTGTKQIAPGVHILYGQGQSFVVEIDAGLVIVDTGPGGKVTSGMIEHLRKVTQRPVHALVYSHGHIGYNAGLPKWLQHAADRGDPRPRVIAHANVPARYARYRNTMPLQERMAEIQFRSAPHSLAGKLPVHDPDETFQDKLVLGEGERRVELLWAPSETDDALAAWVPDARVLYGGPAVIDAIPNIGTPLRTLRDTLRWADTLERLAALRPDILVREFGPSLEGDATVQKVLLSTIEALRWLHREVVQRLNQGLGEREILATMEYPAELFDQPWMAPTYGDPSYIVRDIYRSENGWWDRNPTSLHPAAPDEAGRAIADAITDKAAIIASAQALADAGKHQLALHVIDVLATAIGEAPELAQARQLKAQWLRQRAREVSSYVSRSLYHAAATMIENGSAHHFSIR